MNAKEEPYCTTISVRIPTELKHLIDRAAASERASRTAWVTRAVVAALERKRREVPRRSA
jgi:uncharacterized protein (DUF1778 family)